MSLAACMSPTRQTVGQPEGAFDKPSDVASLGLRPSAAAAAAAAVAVAGCRPRSSGQAATRTAPSAVSAVLDRTPVEVLVEVFRHLDMRSAFCLAAADKRFANIFATNRASIVLSIAAREFSPLNGLLQVVKAAPADLGVPWGTWLDKRIRRRNVVLCPGGTIPAHCPGNTAAMRIVCAEARVEDADIDRVVAVCRVVRGWERIFPQHRFNASPLMTRSLTPRENARLRRALYHWMRYAYYFHGDLPRPSLFSPWGRDVRINQLRTLSNSELGELKDLWRTVEDIIELTMCPSIDNVRIGADYELSEKDAARIGWGEQRENRIVVKTMSKLAPDELLHYVENAHKYTKMRLIQDVRQRHPHFEYDTESLTAVLSCVGMERWRRMQVAFPSVAQQCSNGLCLPVFTRISGACRGGILDWDDPETEEGYARIGEMTGHNLDWRPQEDHIGYRMEIPTGLLNP
ncbi:histone deacetylase [Niveomyces insectorum RCEF 264]|uniref:Histone deacetylase n=1 Tax=Niveomyces insectorum RCEF 264 TaxID=1081102 RepID=A0A167NTW5_9HYPO|nr:histone deacetylase [Niveomyces insectorum RCEF 264]